MWVITRSGERADRPDFLKMLEVVKTGEADVVLCWRDDRLVRHPRVAVAIIDALEEGDKKRKDDIQIIDATGAPIDRDTLQVMAVFWKGELIDETEEACRYWMSELARLKELSDNQDRVQAGLDYVNQLLTSIQKKLPEVDIPPDELKALPVERRNEILTIRRDIVRALVDKVEVWSSRHVKIHGLLDGSEAAQFELGSLNALRGPCRARP